MYCTITNNTGKDIDALTLELSLKSHDPRDKKMHKLSFESPLQNGEKAQVYSNRASAIHTFPLTIEELSHILIQFHDKEIKWAGWDMSKITHTNEITIEKKENANGYVTYKMISS